MKNKDDVDDKRDRERDRDFERERERDRGGSDRREREKGDKDRDRERDRDRGDRDRRSSRKSRDPRDDHWEPEERRNGGGGEVHSFFSPFLPLLIPLSSVVVVHAVALGLARPGGGRARPAVVLADRVLEALILALVRRVPAVVSVKPLQRLSLAHSAVPSTPHTRRLSSSPNKARGKIGSTSAT